MTAPKRHDKQKPKSATKPHRPTGQDKPPKPQPSKAPAKPAAAASAR